MPPSPSKEGAKGSISRRGFGWSAERLALAGSLALAAIAYGASIHGPFTIDDSRSVVSNPDVTGGAPLQNAFVDDYWGTPLSSPASHKSYRPLTVLSFRLTYAIHGLNSAAFHAWNVALHALCVWMAHRVIRAVLLARPHGRDPAAGGALAVPMFAGAAVFAVHPVHTEAVSNVTGRAELLSFAAAAMAFLAADRFAKALLSARAPAPHGTAASAGAAALRRGTACVVWAVVAALFKENGLASLAVCAVWVLLRCGLRARRAWLFASVCVATVTTFAAHRKWLAVRVTPEFSAIDNHIHFAPLWPQRILTAAIVHAEYARLLFFPARLSTDYGMGCLTLVDASGWIADSRVHAAFAVYVCLAVAVAFAAVRALGWPRGGGRGAGNEKGERGAHGAPACDLGWAVSLAWILAPAAPASHLFPIGTVVAERVMYTPSLGVCLLVACAVDSFCRGRTEAALRRERCAWSLFWLSLPIALFTLRCHVRAHDWMVPIRLFESDLLSCPGSCRTISQIGVQHHIQNDFATAARRYEEAISLCNGTESKDWQRVGYDHPHHMLGLLLKTTGGDMERATRHFGHAAKIAPLDAAIAKSHGYGLFVTGRAEEALAELKRSVALNATDAEAQRNYAAVSANLGDVKAGAAHMGEALRLSLEQRLDGATVRDAALDYAKLLRSADRIDDEIKLWEGYIVWFPAESERARSEISKLRGMMMERTKKMN